MLGDSLLVAFAEQVEVELIRRGQLAARNGIQLFQNFPRMLVFPLGGGRTSVLPLVVPATIPQGRSPGGIHLHRVLPLSREEGMQIVGRSGGGHTRSEGESEGEEEQAEWSHGAKIQGGERPDCSPQLRA